MELVVRNEGREERVRVESTAQGYRVRIGDTTYQVDLALIGNGLQSLLIDGKQTEVTVRHQGDGRYRVTSRRFSTEVSVTDPLTFLAQQTHGQTEAQGLSVVTAYMPGRVTAILAQEGDAVVRGQGILVLEAMKMENEIQADADGVLCRLLVEEGQAVEAGDPLFEVG